MSLRIIGGRFRNRLLKTPKGDKTRPTLAIMRKAVFDMLQFSLPDASFLDLFAGSGIMGIEALSRGAAHATFVDKDRHALSCIKDNLELLQLTDQADILACDAKVALQQCAKKKLTYDIIYIDPPYKLSQTTPLLTELLHFIDTHQLLNPEGTLLVEETTPASLNHFSSPHLRFIDSRQFSDSILHQFRRINFFK